jgi:sugar lactone lactonase YvrE
LASLAVRVAAQSTYATPYTFTTLAGTAPSSGSADGTGPTAQFFQPSGVAVDGSGNVYVADKSNHTIRKITSGGVVTTLAGLAGTPGSVDNTGSFARFRDPSGVAVDGSGNVYVADSTNHTIRKITSGGVVTTLAGLAGSNGSVDDTGSAARFKFPAGVAVDGSGNVFVADYGNHTIRKITSGGAVTTLAGLAPSSGWVDDTGSVARFSGPSAVSVDSGGNVYVADTFNNTIRKVTSLGVVTTVAGLGPNPTSNPGSADGTGTAARFNNPQGVSVDSSGNLYVADTNNHLIRKITTGGVVTTIAGLVGSSGSADGIGSVARFNLPFGVAVDVAGNVYVPDYFNHTIRKGAGNFASWQQSKFTAGELLDANISGPNAVFGLDGLSNLIKYALGLEPRTNITTGLPAVTVVSSDWVFTYVRSAGLTDITYAVQVSTDLTTWTTVGVTHELVSGSGGLETWRGRYPLASATNAFFRLNVTQL